MQFEAEEAERGNTNTVEPLGASVGERRRRELDAADEVGEDEQVAHDAAVEVPNEHIRERLAVLRGEQRKRCAMV